MELDLEKQTLTIYGKTERLSVLANRFQALSGKQTYEFLTSRGVFLPRKINVLALRSVLNERIKTLKASELPKEYYETLDNYENFSEYQLFNLFATICDNKDDFKLYRLNLWKLILINYNALILNDGEINYLKNISKLQTEKLENYFQYITSASREMDNSFDGIELDKLKQGLKNAGSIEDVLDIAIKYGIELPLEYDIDNFKSALKEYLAAYDKLTMELDSYIENASEMTLENFAIKNKIPLSFKMDKDKLIDYLFFILSIAEMPRTSIKKIVEPDNYKPLKFRVDVINSFDNDIPLDNVRIIYYDGCENDGLFSSDEFEANYEENINQQNYQQEELIEEKEEIKETIDKTSEVEEETINESTNEINAIEEKEESSEALLARAQKTFEEEEKKERKELSFGDVEENPYYGSPKTKKLYASYTKMIISIFFIAVLVLLGVGFILKFTGII